MKDYSGAETSLKQGLELSPDAAAAKYELAKILLGLGPLARCRAFRAGRSDCSARTCLSSRFAWKHFFKQRNAPGALEQCLDAVHQ
jgi:hypothetical protein